MSSPLPQQCSNSLGSLFIQAIKIRKLKRLNKTQTNITPYEVKLLNKSIQILFTIAKERAYSQMLQQTEIDYFISVFAQYYKLHPNQKIIQHQNYMLAKKAYFTLLA